MSVRCRTIAARLFTVRKHPLFWALFQLFFLFDIGLFSVTEWWWWGLEEVGGGLDCQQASPCVRLFCSRGEVPCGASNLMRSECIALHASTSQCEHFCIGKKSLAEI